MKKIFVVLCMFLSLSACVYARGFEVLSNQETAKTQEKISQIGFRILNANGIKTRTMFVYDTDKTINAGTSITDRHIVFYRGLYNMLNTDDEVAAVLAHEISHSVDSYDGIFRGYFSVWSYVFSPKKYEYKADKRAVDYMVKAGYHPAAMIVMMNKAMPQQRYDWCNSHPLATRRMMEVYEYIYKKYPEYLVNNPYKTNTYYQNFLLTSKENREKLKKKIETKSKGSVRYM